MSELLSNEWIKMIKDYAKKNGVCENTVLLWASDFFEREKALQELRSG